MKSRKFRFALLPTLAALTGVLLMSGLGVWQLQRGQAKQRLIDQHAAAQLAEPVDVRTAAPASSAVQKVFASGHYSAEPAVLLDNQTHQRQPGVLVLNAFVLADGSSVLVNRGWVPLARGEPPAVTAPSTEEQRIDGLWHAIPVAAMHLGGPSTLCTPGAARPRAVNYPSLAELRCLFGRGSALRDGLLDLSPNAPEGFVRDRSSSAAEAVPPSRHYGYAAQWWAFAATLLVLFFRYSLIKIES